MRGRLAPTVGAVGMGGFDMVVFVVAFFVGGM